MKAKHTMPLIIALITLSHVGCSATKETATSEDGFDSPEAVFEAMKDSPDSIQADHLLPAERPMVAYQLASMVRISVAFEQDPGSRKSAEAAFEGLISKYGLADRLEFTDQNGQVPELAERAFEDVDCKTFMNDCYRFLNEHDPSTTPSEEEDAFEWVAMENLTLSGDQASATVHGSDDSEEKVVFVRRGGRCFFHGSRARMRTLARTWISGSGSRLVWGRPTTSRQELSKR